MLQEMKLPASSACDIVLLYFDKSGLRNEVILERRVNVDLFNIRHFRSLLSSYFKTNQDHFTYLIFKPSDEIKPLL